MAQQLMFEIVLDLAEEELLDIPLMRSIVAEFATKIDQKESNYDAVKADLKTKSLMEIKR